MKSLPTHSPSNVAALDDADEKCGNAHHLYAIQYGGPSETCPIQFQHGPRAVADSVQGVFDDDLLAIVESRLTDFQTSQFSCEENALALHHIQEARQALASRVAARMKKGVLGVNQTH